MPRILSEHVRLDATRRNTVDRDALDTKIGRKSLHHSDDSHLGCTVQRMMLDTHQAGCDRRHQNDPPILLKILERGLPHKKLCPRIQIEHMVELLLRDLLRLIPALRPTVAHHDINLAKHLLCLCKQPVDLADLGHIRLDADGAGAIAERLDLLADFVGGGLGRSVVDDDRGAAAAELNSTAAPDAATGAGDEGDFVVEGGGGDGDDWLGHLRD